ncbi:DUF202 domain-containing protein [Candidatus Symbiopectobacterium sp. NZEC127]|uniref:DUF202 domain-containing protein n=1 Tax=Candidatus Symbiopectobacterium sp. NZEC127 TaxID=2820472 RepID=UPI002226C008|nr:DUF202 domain-containing protein [Candidatus Symbiopectobacterium sp. NZEC127]
MVNRLPAAPDPGLQPQRTGMAWSRSVLLALIVSLLCFRFSFDRGSGLALLCSVLLLILAVVMVAMSVWRLRFMHQRPASGAAWVRYAIAFCSTSVVVTALVLAGSLLHALSH